MQNEQLLTLYPMRNRERLRFKAMPILLYLTLILACSPVGASAEDAKPETALPPDQMLLPLGDAVTSPQKTYSTDWDKWSRLEAVAEVLDAEALVAATGNGQDQEKQSVAADSPPIVPDATVQLLTEGFEGVFPGTWSVFDNDGATNGELYWDDTSQRSDVGSWSANPADGGANAVTPGSDYANNMRSWMINGPFDLSDATGGSFAFRYWLNSEVDYDYFKFLVSINGTNFYGYQTSGNSGGWLSQSIDFTAVPTLGDITGQANVWVAFVFDSDESVTAPEGAYVDEVSVTKTTSASPADLALQSVNATDGTYAPGDDVLVNNVTQNIGGETSPSYRIDFYASTDTNITAADYSLGYVPNRPALAAGGTHNYNTTVTLPGGLPENSYYIGAIITVTDANSANNSNYDSTPITVALPGEPDIRISPLALDFAEPAPNQAGEQPGQQEQSPVAQGIRDLDLHFRHGRFTPSIANGDFAPSMPVDSEIPRGHRIIQFSRIPSVSQRSDLEARGIRLLQYIPNNAYWASFQGPTIISSVEQIAGRVLYVGRPGVEFKQSAAVLSGDFPQHATNQDGTLDIQVLLFEDVTQADATDSILGAGDVEIIEWRAPNLVLLRLDRDLVQAIAELDEVHWIEPAPAPNTTENVTAAARIGVNILQSSPYFLDGTGVTVGIWDGGAVDPHNDFDTRLTVRDAVAAGSHATHVAGTVGGSGAGNASAKGMAPNVDLESFDWNSDLTEMRAAAVDISNHSYGFITGWYWNGSAWVDYGDTNFGYYSSSSAAWDDVVFDTGLLIFKSAGNDRNDGPDCPAGPRCDGPYDNIGTQAMAKNLVAVCATDDVDGMSSFSSWGPADDGRVKPDLCANGVGLTSTGLGQSYYGSSGTSMSSPSAAGAGAVLFEHFVATASSAPPPHLLKALMIHGADDLGRPGPDYEFGWGIIDAVASADLITAGSYVISSIGSTDDMQEFVIDVPPNTDELKITIAWTDPPGSPQAALALVNDLDLVLVAPDASEHLPWVLDGSSPTTNATTGVNDVDNIEQVLIDQPAPGEWTIRVSGTAVPTGPQEFALVAPGVDTGGSKSFTIFNDGGTNLSITQMSLDSPGAWIDWSPQAPFSIAPGGSRVVSVSVDFDTAPVGMSSRRLVVASDDPDENPYPGGVDINVDNSQTTNIFETNFE